MNKKYRLAVLNSHPIQYFAPLYRAITANAAIDLTVYYCSRQGLDGGHIDPGFGEEVVWDIPLLEGYRWRFLSNIWGEIGVGGFFSLVNPGILLELWRARYDAIILHGHGFATNIIALFAAKLVGTRVFIRGETHLLLRRRGPKRWIRKPVMTTFYRLCDACLYIGTMNRAFYEAHGVPKSKLFFVPYAVDNEWFIKKVKAWAPQKDETKKALDIAPETAVILYVSKLTTRKRPADLLKAFELMGTSGVSAALVVIGDGPERGALERYVQERGIPSVTFLGFKNQSELPRYYAIADVFVLPSANEPWGLVINEVMCAGVPVITTIEVGAYADLVIAGETGFTYVPGDVESLHQRLERILVADEERNRIRRNCGDRMEQWGFRECIQGIEQALRATVLRNDADAR